VKLRLGTRGSPLALAQTRLVADALRPLGVDIEVVPIRTSGDRLAQAALADFGGKALFVQEIEDALAERRIDVGVHSLKDVPATLPAGLCLAAFPPREDPADVLVSRIGGRLGDLPPGAVVGTSSLRRGVLVRARRPDLRVAPIRGNVETRLAKLAAGDFDAIILARAGLLRLGVRPEHATELPVDEFTPAAGQGILGLEARIADGPALEMLGRLDDTRSRMEALAERAFLRRLGAGCHTPVAAHGRLDGGDLTLVGVVASADAAVVLRATARGAGSAAEAIGAQVADDLLGRGAGRFLAANGPAGSP